MTIRASFRSTTLAILVTLQGALAPTWCAWISARADCALSITPPSALNGNAYTSTEADVGVSITTDRNGQWVAIWSSLDSLMGTVGTDGDIFVSRSSNLGASWTFPVPLSTNADSDSTNDYGTALRASANGTWIAVWGAYDSSSDDTDVLISRSIDNGISWTVPSNIQPPTENSHDYGARLATDGQGTWLVVWWSWELVNGLPAESDLYYVLSIDDGINWSDPTALNTNASNDAGSDAYPAIATDGSGTWIVSWNSDDTLGGTLNSNVHILYSRSIDNGLTWSAPTPLNANAPNILGYESDPSIASDGNGTWIAEWTSSGIFSSDNDIAFARSTDGGTTWTAPAPLNTNAFVDTVGDFARIVEFVGLDTWLATWESGVSLAVARSLDGGATWSAPCVLAGQDNHVPSIAFDGTGTAIIAWQSQNTLGGTIGSDFNILMARILVDHDCNDNGANDSDDLLTGNSADCNANAIPDECDIASEASSDANENAIPDECEDCCGGCDDGNVCTGDRCANGLCIHEPVKHGDVSPCGGDGVVNIDDILAVLQAFSGVDPCKCR